MGTPVGSRLMANGLSTQAHSRSMGKKAAVPTGCLCRALVLLGNFASLSPNIHQVPREAAGLNPHSRNLKLLCAGTYASRQGSGPLSPKASNVEEGGCKGLLFAQHALHSGQDQVRPCLCPTSYSVLKTQPKSHL